MANIFRNTAVYYFQVPQHIMQSSIWRELKPVSQSLYIHLLYLAQGSTSPVTTLTAGEINESIGLSCSSVNTARTGLEARGLIRSIDRGKSGFMYEILDPFTERSLVKMEDFNRLSPDLLEAYFRHHVSGYGPELFESGLKFRCPFHESKAVRTNGDETLSVKLSDGGLWSCRGFEGCGRSGKLVAFEIEMAAKRGRTITSTEAHHNVQRIVTKAAHRQAQEAALELAKAREILGAHEAFQWGLLYDE